MEKKYSLLILMAGFFSCPLFAMDVSHVEPIIVEPTITEPVDQRKLPGEDDGRQSPFYYDAQTGSRPGSPTDGGGTTTGHQTGTSEGKGNGSSVAATVKDANQEARVAGLGKDGSVGDQDDDNVPRSTEEALARLNGGSPFVDEGQTTKQGNQTNAEPAPKVKERGLGERILRWFKKYLLSDETKLNTFTEDLYEAKVKLAAARKDRDTILSRFGLNTKEGLKNHNAAQKAFETKIAALKKEVKDYNKKVDDLTKSVFLKFNNQKEKLIKQNKGLKYNPEIYKAMIKKDAGLKTIRENFLGDLDTSQTGERRFLVKGIKNPALTKRIINGETTIEKEFDTALVATSARIDEIIAQVNQVLETFLKSEHFFTLSNLNEAKVEAAQAIAADDQIIDNANATEQAKSGAKVFKKRFEFKHSVFEEMYKIKSAEEKEDKKKPWEPVL